MGSENYSGKKIRCPYGRAGSIPAVATKHMNNLFEQLWVSAQNDERSLKCKIGALTTDVPLSFQGIYWNAVTLPHIECTREIVNAIEFALDKYDYSLST